MRAVLSALSLAICATSAAAQTPAVRAGEHEGFTRLVVPLPPGDDWTLTRREDEQRIELRFADGAHAFDLARTFDLIKRTRIADVVQRKTGLDIALACDCAFEQSIYRERLLVIDVRDETATAPPLPPSPTAPVKPSAFWEGSPVALGPALEAGTRAQGLGFETTGLLATSATPEKPGMREEDSALKSGRFETHLAEQLAAAASRGLLDASDSLGGSGSGSGTSGDMSEDQSVASPGSERVSARNAADGRDLKIEIGGFACTPDEALAVADWSGEEEPFGRIARLRRSLYGEFDIIDGAKLTELARVYLHLGFGAEARALFGIDGAPDAPELVAMASILDGEPDPARHFANQFGCDGAAALWALLAREAEGTPLPTKEDAILKTFDGLPRHLRVQLGPRLVTSFTKNGNPDSARLLVMRLQREPGEPEKALDLAVAQLDLAEGHTDRAADAFDALSSETDAIAAEAISGAMEIAALREAPVEPQAATLAEAFATEYRETAQGTDLWRAKIRAFIASSAFPAAFAAIADPSAPEDLVSTMTAEAFSALSENARSVDFLKYALSDKWMLQLPNRMETLEKVAGRFLAIGLAEKALGILDRIRESPLSESSRVMKARALLDLSRPEEAEIALIGLRGEEVALLRALARSRMGDFDFAQSVFRELGMEQKALQAAWLDGDWSTLSTQTDGALSAAARLMQPSEDYEASEKPQLAASIALAEASAASRDILEEMLAATRLTEDE